MDENNKVLKQLFGRYFRKGIHGLQHTQRVNTLSSLIYFFEGGNLGTWQEINTAAKFHDIGRVNDYGETTHGSLSVDKIIKLIPDLHSWDLDLDLVKYLMINHSVGDNDIPYVDERYQISLEILKDADGLDRVRIGDLDPRYLRLGISPQLVEIAYYLLEEVYPEKGYY
jgi:hypothetical protein